MRVMKGGMRQLIIIRLMIITDFVAATTSFSGVVNVSFLMFHSLTNTLVIRIRMSEEGRTLMAVMIFDVQTPLTSLGPYWVMIQMS